MIRCQSGLSCEPGSPRGNHGRLVTHDVCPTLHLVRREMLDGVFFHGNRDNCLRCPACVCAGWRTAAQWFGACGDHSLLAGGGVFVVVVIAICTSGVADVIVSSSQLVG